MKEVVNVPGYFIDLNGNVYNSRGKQIKPFTNKRSSHLRVALRKEGKQVKKLVHVLLLETYVCPRPDGMFACHNDGNPINNKLENLRWDTPASNTFDSCLHGTHNTCKLNQQDVKDIRWLLSMGVLQKEVALMFGVSRNNISQINRGYSWRTYEAK